MGSGVRGNDQAEPTSTGANWPRILFFGSEPPSLSGAGSIYFHRLLQGVPPSHLCVATHRPLPDESERLECPYLHLQLPLSRLQNTRLWKLRFLSRLVGAASFVSFNAIDRGIPFTPQVVVTLMQDSLAYETASRYARERGLPLCVFIHDLAHGFEPLPRFIEPLRLRADRALLARSAGIVAVSEGMRAYLSDTWKLPSRVILPPAPDDPVSRPAEACRTLKHAGRLTLGYAGGLHYGYGDQLARIVPVLRRTNTRLEAFGDTPSERESALRTADDVITFHGRLKPDAAWREIVESCDAVLQPYANPPGPHALQYRTHFPSKLADMVNLGLPLVVIGPGDSSGVRWCAAQTGSALCVTDSNPSAFENALLALREDPDLRVNLARGAQRYAPVFDVGRARECLADVLKSIVPSEAAAA